MKNGFTKVPNKIIRYPELDAYEKMVLIMILSCGDKSFPSYKTLCAWGGMSRDKIWKVLRKLEQEGFIGRFRVKGDARVFYATRWNKAKLPPEATQIYYKTRVRNTDFDSPPDGLCQSATQTWGSPPDGPYKDSVIKNHEEDSIRRDEFFQNVKKILKSVPK